MGPRPPPPGPSPPAPSFSWGAVGVLLKIPGGGVLPGEERGGARGVCGEFFFGGGGRGRRAPFTAKTSPLFGENALFRLLSGPKSPRARTKAVVRQHTLLRRVLRRVLEIAFEKVLKRVLRRCLAVCFTRRKGSEKGF